MHGKMTSNENLEGNIYNPTHRLSANLSKMYKLLQIAKKRTTIQMDMNRQFIAKEQ